MRSKIEIYEQDLINNQRINQINKPGLSSVDTIENNPVKKILASEGREFFFNYIDWLGLAKDENPVILSSIHHYYYDTEEMKNVNTVINLKELNQVKKLKDFLHSVFQSLSNNSHFVGCFVDNNNINGYDLRKNSSTYHSNKRFDDIENGIVSRNPILNMLFSIMDMRTNKHMSKRIVSTLLNDYGFRVLDMTEINGLTYFCAQRLKTAEN